MPYELIDHTADIGIRVTETSIPKLFQTAAVAMFEQITDISKLEGAYTKDIRVTGIDRTDLLINWLRELLCSWTIDNYLVRQVIIHDMTGDRLNAECSYDEFSPWTHEILKDIKAVTYHGVSIDKTAAGWEATVIFDV